VSVEPIRVLIADDHPVFRDGLRVLLEASPEVELVGEAARRRRRWPPSSSRTWS
jgi:DNA-binding NarL/FixJ family response regulator